MGVSDDTLDVAAAARLLGRSENTVRRLIRAGELPADQVNGTRAVEYRLHEADVRDALGRLGAKASSRSWARGRLDAYNDGRVGASVGASSVSAAPAPTSAAAAGVAGVQALIEQATAPLIEANRGLQDANERLTDQLMRQAEEVGRLRERQRDAEAVRTTQPAEGHADTPPDHAPRSDDPGALWATLAAHVRPAPTLPEEPMPVLPPRRSLLWRLLHLTS
jgi:excisionase family DNA binding protein